MASFSVTSRTTFSTAIVLLLLLLVSTTKAQQPKFLTSTCENAVGNNTTNSTFNSNLLSLLRALMSKAAATGFSDGKLGSIPNRVYGLVLCRGDVDSTTCRSCLSISFQRVLRQCQFAKAAEIWYDYCFLQYSNTTIAFNVDEKYKYILLKGDNVTYEWPRFNQSLGSLWGQLRTFAAYNKSAPPPRMFATGLIKFNKQCLNIIALAQCTRDLTPDQCNQCLTNLEDNLYTQKYQEYTQYIGGTFIAQRCNFRYEVYSFYNGTPRISLPAITDSKDTTFNRKVRLIGPLTGGPGDATSED